MKKLLLVAKNEYSRHVFQRRFIFSLASVPLVITLMIMLIFLIVSMENDASPIGYIDHAGLLVDKIMPPEPTGILNPKVDILEFPDVEEAQESLSNGNIQAFFLITEGYWNGEPIELHYVKDYGDNALSQFKDFVQVNLMKEQPADISVLIAEGFEIVQQTADGSRSFTDSNIMQFLAPFLVGLAFMILMFTGGGYLMSAVVEEKENRTMEIMMTSISPTNLLGGKILGIVGITFTQLIAWILFAIVAIFIGDSLTGTSILSELSFNPADIIVYVLVLIPAYVMISALMAMIGSTVSESSEGQQFTGLITLPVVAPYWFTAIIMESPNSPLVRILSYFPLTAPGTLSMRMAFTAVPASEIAITIILLVLSAAGTIWLAGKAFRLGMLRYGQKLSLREIFSKQNAKA